MATIIKRESAHQLPAGDAVREVAFDFKDLAGHADEYVESVRREAAKVVQQAHADAKQVREQAEKAGRQAAEAAIESLLNEKVAKQMQTIKPALETLVAQLADARGAWLDHWDNAAVQLSAMMAEKIVRRELAERPELTLDWLREALELAAGASEITVRLSPEDQANLGPQAEAIAESMGKLTGTRIVADPAITRGGCVVDTQYGRIDQQVESQLARLVQDLA